MLGISVFDKGIGKPGELVGKFVVLVRAGFVDLSACASYDRFTAVYDDICSATR